MTLIVGVKCTDGIALAADTRVSFGSVIQQDTAHKLDLVGDNVIIAVSGSKDIAQEHLLEIQKQVRENPEPPYKNVDEAKQFYSRALADRFATLVARIKASPINFEDFGPLSHETLLACPIPATGTTHLLYFDPFFVCTEINDFYPIHAIGSGTEAALFFGTFIRRIVYRDRMPTVREALAGAYWIVDMAIKCNTEGVGGQIDCGCLRMQHGRAVGTLLGREGLSEIHSFLSNMEQEITGLFRNYPGSSVDG